MTVYTAKNGEVFIQPKGPGPANSLVSLGQCTDLDDITEPLTTSEPIICRDKYGKFIQVGEMETPPGKVTGSVTIMAEQVRSALEKLDCNFAMYVVQKTCGKKGDYYDGEIFTILQNARKDQQTFGRMVNRNTSAESTVGTTISAWFPVIRAVGASKLTVERVGTTEVQALNDIAFNDEVECNPACNDIGECEQGLIGADAAGGATANALFSANFGASWTAGGADPFGVGLHIGAVARVLLPGGGERWIVGKIAVGGAQGLIAYSDNDGAAWTTVNIGGAAAGHGVTYGGGIFALDYSHIWLVGAAGYIYFSDDGGVTWTVQNAALVTAGAYTQVKFWNENIGFAVAAAGVVAFTRDGGAHWAAGGVINAGAAGNLCCDFSAESKVFVGDDAGDLWYSTDLGLTWTEVTSFPGTGVGDVRDIDVVNEHVIWMAYNTAAPVGYLQRTIDGGKTWQRLTNTVTNSGLNAVHACDENLAFAVGEANGGTGLIYRAYEG